MKAPTVRAREGQAIATVSIPEAPETPDETALTAAERTHFATLTTVRRRAEWWAGRVAAHAALEAVGGVDLSILADARGVPRIVGATAASYFVSISHGRRLAAGAATGADARHPCLGIDVLDPEDEARVIGIAPRFLTAEERALVAAEPRAALLAWGAREAIAKATSTGMFAFALQQGAIRAVDWEAGRITTVLEGFEVVFESIPGDGLVVLAGASRETAAWARARAGLTPPDPV